MHPRILLTLLLSVALALPLNFGLIGEAGAASERGVNRFAAIAVDPQSNTADWSFDYLTRAGAERRALRECRIRSATTGCRGIVWVRNGCASVAVRKRRDGSLSRIAWAIAETRFRAQRRADARCESDGRRCFVRAWACSG